MKLYIYINKSLLADRIGIITSNIHIIYYIFPLKWSFGCEEKLGRVYDGFGHRHFSVELFSI